MTAVERSGHWCNSLTARNSTSRPPISRRRRRLLAALPLLLLSGCRTPVSQVESPSGGVNDYDPTAFAESRQGDADQYQDYKDEQEALDENYREADGN